MRHVRTIWPLFAALIILAISGNAHGQSVRSVDNGYIVEIETRIKVVRSVNELNISSYPGDVEIERTQSTEALFTESIYVEADNKDDARAMAQELASEIDDNMSEIRVRGARETNRAHSLQIIIPVFVEVDVSSAYGNVELSGGEARARLATGVGDIHVEGLDSSVEIITGAGDVEAINISGSVTARSGAGDVELNDIGSDVAVITGAGEIDLVDIVGRVSATTGGGQIDGNRLTGNLTLLTAGGDIELGFVEGNMELNTSGGSIELNEIIGDVRAKTAGGDIEARNVVGSLVAETLAGDVEVFGIAGDVKIVSKVGDIYVRVETNSQISADRINLRAENGDIDLLLPRQMDADIRVDLGYVGSLETHQFSGELVWDTTRRAPQDDRIRRATGRINGGGVDIELSSGFGNIIVSDNHR